MKISAVIIARNDNYGGNLNHRALHCINSMIESMDEVFYVDWNSNTRSLLEEFRPEIIKSGKLKHIIIPPEQAKILTKNDPRVQTCCEVLGRNIAIRRATGDYIITTNIDIIAPLRETIIGPWFDPKCLYTYSRRDIALDTVKGFGYTYIGDIQKKLLCDINKYAPRGPSGAYPGDRWSLIDSCGDFQIGTREIWHTIRGYEESQVGRGFSDTTNLRKAANHGYRIEARYDVPIFHIAHTGGFGGSGHLNSMADCILNMGLTKNSDTWGFSDINFNMEVI